MTTSLFAEGIAVAAEYHTPVVREYRDNPFIEALPPTLGREDAKRAMAVYPEYDARDRLESDIDREHMASLLMAIRHPVGLHAELHSRFSRLIRNGYIARNPTRSYFQANIDARERAITITGKGVKLEVSAYPIGVGERPSSTGLTFLGITGVGKTAAVEMCLRLYPQLIVHSEYRGQRLTRTQIIWLRINAGKNGSILGLCERFFTAVDALHQALKIPTDYLGQYMGPRTSVDRAIPRMARVAAQHGLGVLVIDEIQELQMQGSRTLLSFLVELVNTVGIPVVLVGGIDALPVLRQQFRQARRGASEGDLIVREAERGRDWRAFCEVLWRYQYTRHETPLTDKHVAQLFEESQGITDYLVKAYKLAQIRAISTGLERVTPGVIRSIRDSLAGATPTLEALRKSKQDPGHLQVLRRAGDVVLPKDVNGIPFLRADPVAIGATGVTDSAPDRLQFSTPAAPASVPLESASLASAPPRSAQETSTEARATSAVAPVARATRPAKPVPRGSGMRGPAATTTPPAGTASADGGSADVAWGSDAESVERPSGAAYDLTIVGGATLRDVVRAARQDGMSAHDGLVAHGVIGDALWTAIADPEVR